ncbi:hypothetical protein H4R34_002379 [Dimargaris verticillata]|uniref:Ribosome maturation protein SDO1/SBDS N-terminal domain-containing protein n=1 Tax=Dimargaris verticillata TaxID=2761393 RepID=A0A9W8B2V3_9FUNG|nr:hypothetical protein H4R34_002379 [Dimargaris verticillata]
MSNHPVKVTFKEPEKNSPEFYIFADSNMIKKWRHDKSVPLTQVVENFDIYQSDSGGNTGLASRPTQSVLKDTFNTSNEDEICRFILEKGAIKGEHSEIDESKNAGRGFNLQNSKESHVWRR